MEPDRLRTSVGPLRLRSPLIAASGTVGSVWEWAEVADVSVYGAAVAKSVAGRPLPGRPAPRLGPTGVGMLNGIGIQNPGIGAWIEDMKPRLGGIGVPVWGSAVGEDPEEFARVGKGLAAAGVEAIEVNLSCPNLEDGRIFSLDPRLSQRVIAAVTAAVRIPVGAKLSPNTEEIVAVASACLEAGAEFLTLTNTALGFGISVPTRRPILSGGSGGYSGPGLKPLALRCVYEVARAIPGASIIGCGGVWSGRDMVEYLLAGASAVAVGTLHLAEPKAGTRLEKELLRELDRQGASAVEDLIGAVEPW